LTRSIAIALFATWNTLWVLHSHGLIDLFAALVIHAGACGAGWLVRPLSTRTAALLGEASYALYLFHYPLWWWLDRLYPAPAGGTTGARLYALGYVLLAVALVFPGALAIVYGDAVSQALSNIAAGSISRLLGTLLVVGSTLTLIGIARNRTLTETLGLTVTAIGCAIYGLGVILGLGLHGAVAGSGFLAIAAGTIRRVITLAAVAREVDRASES